MTQQNLPALCLHESLLPTVTQQKCSCARGMRKSRLSTPQAPRGLPPAAAARLPGKQKWFGPQGGALFAKVLIMKQS